MSSSGGSTDPKASRPLGITSPRSPRDERAAPADMHAALNVALQTPGSWAGTPPPNIPPRNGSFTRLDNTSPAKGAAFPASRDTPSVIDAPGAAFDGTRLPATPHDLEEVPDEDKAKVLRRHLVSRDERDNTSSRRTSVSASPRVDTLWSEPGASGESVVGDVEFPIPYSTPGGDITHVYSPAIIAICELTRCSAAMEFTSGSQTHVVRHCGAPALFLLLAPMLPSTRVFNIFVNLVAFGVTIYC